MWLIHADHHRLTYSRNSPPYRFSRTHRLRIHRPFLLRLAGRLERQRLDVIDDLPNFLLRERALGALSGGAAGGHRRAAQCRPRSARRHRSAAGRRETMPSRKLRGIALRGGKIDGNQLAPFVVFLLSQRGFALRLFATSSPWAFSRSAFNDWIWPILSFVALMNSLLALLQLS